MRYEILSPLRVVDERGARSIAAPKVQLLLALLLSKANQMITTNTIMAELWPEGPPRRAGASLHVYVSQLRKFLRRPDRAESSIITHKSGYRLVLDGDELDAEIFLLMTRGGRQLARARRITEAEDHLERALSVWRGPLLGDLERGQQLNAYTVWLEQEKLDCTELLIDARLALGRHREVIGWLHALIGEHPLRESLYSRLMLALYRSERQAEALSVYQSAFHNLDRELGVAPCRSLQQLRQDILTAHQRLELELAR